MIKATYKENKTLAEEIEYFANMSDAEYEERAARPKYCHDHSPDLSKVRAWRLRHVEALKRTTEEDWLQNKLANKARAAECSTPEYEAWEDEREREWQERYLGDDIRIEINSTPK